MSLTITTIKAKIAPKLRGTTLAQLGGDFFDKCQEAAGLVLLRTNPLETIRSARIENAIYSHVYNYAIASDVKGDNGIIDIKPIGFRSRLDEVNARTSREFSSRRDRDTFSIEIVNGIKTLKLSKKVGTHTVLHGMDSLVSEGTVTGSGDVQNLDTNTLEKVAGYGSIQFGLSGATGQGVITIALPSNIDLSSIEDVGALFNWLSFPDATRLTNIVLRWGTDSSNYWYKTITTPHDRAAFESNVFTLQRADWVSATEVGTPDATQIKYLAILINYTGVAPLSNVRLDNITAGGGEAFEATFYSDRFFKSVSGVWLQKPTEDTDILNIAIDGENIFLYELMLIIIQELGEKSLAYSSKWLKEQLNGYGDVPGLYAQYNSRYPSKVLPISQTYYDFGYSGNEDEDD